MIVSGLGPEGRRFESCHPDKRKSPGRPKAVRVLFFRALKATAFISERKTKP